jgi:Na+-transporting NADH:ubiquinone oxidoreductase subunit NqrC
MLISIMIIHSICCGIKVSCNYFAGSNVQENNIGFEIPKILLSLASNLANNIPDLSVLVMCD